MLVGNFNFDFYSPERERNSTCWTNTFKETKKTSRKDCRHQKEEGKNNTMKPDILQFCHFVNPLSPERIIELLAV